jgi:hypothetical protein
MFGIHPFLDAKFRPHGMVETAAANSDFSSVLKPTMSPFGPFENWRRVCDLSAHCGKADNEPAMSAFFRQLVCMQRHS